MNVSFSAQNFAARSKSPSFAARTVINVSHGCGHGAENCIYDIKEMLHDKTNEILTEELEKVTNPVDKEWHKVPTEIYETAQFNVPLNICKKENGDEYYRRSDYLLAEMTEDQVVFISGKDLDKLEKFPALVNLNKNTDIFSADIYSYARKRRAVISDFLKESKDLSPVKTIKVNHFDPLDHQIKVVADIHKRKLDLEAIPVTEIFKVIRDDLDTRVTEVRDVKTNKLLRTIKSTPESVITKYPDGRIDEFRDDQFFYNCGGENRR
jgi:hypothetical protein